MKKKLLPLVLFVVVMITAGCAEDVVPTEQSLDMEVTVEPDDVKSTDIEEEPEGKDPDLG